MTEINLFANRNRDTKVENKHIDTKRGGRVVGWFGRLGPT